MLHYIESDNELPEVIKIISEEKDNCIALDTETTSLDVLTTRLLLLQLGIGKHIFVFNATKMKKLGEVLDFIIFSQKTCIAHNAKFDAKVLRTNTGREVKKWYDTMYTEVLLNSGRGFPFYSLEELVEKYCGKSLDKTVREKFYDREDGEIDFSQEEIDYSADDVVYLKRIRQLQLQAIKESYLQEIENIESRLIPVVADMEYSGVTLDTVVWKEMLKENVREAEELKLQLLETLFSYINFDEFSDAFKAYEFLQIRVTTQWKTRELSAIVGKTLIKQAVGKEFNVDSNMQIKSLLENILSLELASVDKKTLKGLSKKIKSKPIREMLALILEYREANKRVTTYGEKFLAHIHPKTNRIHADFHNIGTATGRFSCSKPNLQNIPKLSLYRNAFIAREGYKIIGIDYSQQEYRLAGALSGDRVIIEAYMSGTDMHTATAAIMFGKSPSDVTPAERNYGKTLNFAILYGTSAYGLRNNLEIPLQKAEGILETFFKGYQALHQYKLYAEDAMIECGYSITASGRRRYIPEPPLFCTPGELRMFYERQKREGFNHIIQGTAADITKLAMLGVSEKNPFGDDLHMLIQVHDELVFEAREEIVNEAYSFVQKEMVDAFQPFLGEIPAIADGYIGDCWEKA